MTTPETAAGKARLQELAQKATPGLWRWFGQVGRYVDLTTAGHGICTVLGAKRLGMQQAEPTFAVGREPGLDHGWLHQGILTGASTLAIREVPYRDDIVDIDNPDARWIAAADPTTVMGLLADADKEIERLTALLIRVGRRAHHDHGDWPITECAELDCKAVVALADPQ
jgi:hypothetical protein